jgi:hypothetical protein
MRSLKIVFMSGLILMFAACNLSFSDKEKELLGETAQDIAKDMNKEQIPRDKKTTASYSKPFCELLTKEVVISTYPNAINFQIESGKEKTPECSINFKIGRNIGALRLSGQHPRLELNDRTFLESLMKANKEWTEISNLGDEAYLFPNKHSPNIIVMKDGLRYYFQLTLYLDSKNNNEDAIKLMHAIFENM